MEVKNDDFTDDSSLKCQSTNAVVSPILEDKNLPNNNSTKQEDKGL